jgi:hypothetical protein
MNFLNKISEKIDLFIKKTYLKKDIIVETEFEKINFKTGKKVEKVKKQDIVLSLKKIYSKNYNISNHKLNYKYVYRTKDGKYIGSNVLSIYLIFKVLQDRYNNNAFILTTKDSKIAILMLGDNNIKVVEKNDEYQQIIENFFQGIEYQEVNVYDIILLLLPKVGNKIIIAIGIFLVVIILLATSTNNNNEQINTIPSIKPLSHKKKKLENFKKKIMLNQSYAKILQTNYFIAKLFNILDLNYNSVWIEQIDFSNNVVTLNSLMPLEGYKKEGSFYQKKVLIRPTIQMLYYYSLSQPIKKTAIQCQNIINQYTDKIYFIADDGSYKVFQLKKEFTPKQATMFLYDLYGCPISIDGNMITELKKMKIKTDLLIKLFF